MINCEHRDDTCVAVAAESAQGALPFLPVDVPISATTDRFVA